MLPLPRSVLSILDDFAGDATHSGTMHTETAFGNAFLELVQESD